MSGLYGPDGRPVAPQRTIPDHVLQQILADHETRLAAIGAQQVHLAITIEYLVEKLGEALPDWKMDPDEYNEFRERRFNEMREEAMEMARARKAQMKQVAVDFQDREPIQLDLEEDTVVENLDEEDASE